MNIANKNLTSRWLTTFKRSPLPDKKALSLNLAATYYLELKSLSIPFLDKGITFSVGKIKYPPRSRARNVNSWRFGIERTQSCLHGVTFWLIDSWLLSMTTFLCRLARRCAGYFRNNYSVRGMVFILLQRMCHDLMGSIKNKLRRNCSSVRNYHLASVGQSGVPFCDRVSFIMEMRFVAH